MSTVFLTNDEFEVRKINNANLLCTNIKGVAVILFYSTKCTHCHDLIPIFKQLPTLFSGCQFGMANIDLCRNAIALSKTTIDPITYVPYIVFYANKRPIIKYSGPHNINEICKFISEVSRTLTAQNFFQDQKGAEQHQNAEPKIPAFSIGIPCGMTRHKGDETKQCDDDVCYLADNEAYNGVAKR